MKQSLVLDFDGTLVDPRPRDYWLYTDIMKIFGVQPLKFDRYWAMRYEATALDYVLFQTYQEAREATSNIKAMTLRYAQMRTEMCELEGYVALDHLLPKVYKTLQELDWKYELHLVSARMRPTTLVDEVYRLGLDRVISTVTATCGDKENTIKKLGNVVAVVGDTEHDIRPAKSLGLKSIALTTGIRSRRLLETQGPTAIIDNFAGVPKLL